MVYRMDAEKDWKRTIRRKAGEFVIEIEYGQLYTKGDGRRRWCLTKKTRKE